MKHKVLFIVGPTASGKTALSLELAKHIDCEIVSADSRQVYRYMDIGTAKPTAEELAAVPHHFIDIINPDDYYSAGQFGTEARIVIENILGRNKQVIVVGGSGLYIRGLIDGFFGDKIADQTIKDKLKEDVLINGISKVYARLENIDPLAANRLHPTDKQRILRALEVFEITGIPYSRFLEKECVPANFSPIMFGIDMDRNVLYQRIENRVDLMISSGLVDEVRKLVDLGYHKKLNALQTVGYKEVFMHFNNQIDYDEMVTLIKQKTRNYAKRQLTWFRKDERIKWLKINDNTQIKNTALHLLESFRA